MAVKVGELYTILSLDDKAFQAGLGKAEGGLQGLAGVAKGVTKTLITSFAAAGAGIAAGLGVSVKSAGDFQQALADVKAVAGQLTDGQMADLRKLALDTGAATRYSAAEAAKGIEELVKAGVALEDIMGDGLTGALNLATAGGLDLASAAEIASTALNSFKADSMSLTDTANILAGAANASATSVGELKYGLSAVSAVASGVGASFNDTATALAVFAQNGLKGSDAGTSLKTMMMNLIPKTKDQMATFKELGLVTAKGTSAFFDQNGELKSMAEIADLLQKSLKHMSAEQRLATLETMFGSDAIRAANILYKEGAAGIQKMNDEMKKVTAAEVAATKLDTFKGSMELLKSAVETTIILIGEPLLAPLTAATRKVTDFVSALSQDIQTVGITQALMNLVPPAFKEQVTWVYDMVQAIRYLSGSFDEELKAMRKTGDGLDSILSPQSMDIAGKIKEVMNTLKAALQSQDWEGLGTILGEGLRTVLNNMGNFGKQLGDTLISQLQQVNWADLGRNAVSFTAGFVLGFIDGILDPVVWAKIIAENWEIILSLFIGILLAPASWIAKLSNALRKIPLVGNMMAWLLNGIKSVGDKAAAPIKAVFKDMGGFFMEGLGTGFKQYAGQALNGLKTVWTRIVTAAKDFGATIYVHAGDWMIAIGKAIGSGTGWVTKQLRILWNDISIILGTWGHKALDFGKYLVEGLWKGVSGASGWLTSKLTTWAGNVADTIKNFFGIRSPSRLMAEYGGYIAEGLALGMKENQKVVEERAKLMSQAVKEKNAETKASLLKQWREMADQIKPYADLMAAAIAGATQKMKDSITLDTSIIRAQFDTMLAKMGGGAVNESKRLILTIEALNAELSDSKKVLTVLEDAYKKMVEQKGVASTEARSHLLLVEQEKLRQAQLEVQIESTTKAFIAQAAALESIDLSSSISKARFERLTASLGEGIVNDTRKLKLNLQELSEELDFSSKKVGILADAYSQMAREYGGASTEAQKALLLLEQERARQAQLESQIRQTNKAIKDQGNDLSSLMTELESIEKKYYSDLAAARKEYDDKVKASNERLAQSEQQLTEQYQSQLDQRAQSLRDFVGIFDEVNNKRVAGGKLLYNLQQQVTTFDQWQQNITALANKGVDKGLIEELRQTGPKAAPEIAALLTLTDDQLKQYVTLWQQKTALAREEAVRQMTYQKADTEAKIRELRSAAAVELEQYRQEWQKKNAQITADTNAATTQIANRLKALAGDMPGLGTSIMDGLIGGVESRIAALKSAVSKVNAALASIGAGGGGSYSPGSSGGTPEATGLNNTKIGSDGLTDYTRAAREAAIAAGGTVGYKGLATGGTVTSSGMTWVGEKGPELLRLPKGSQVLPLDKLSSLNGIMRGLEGLTARIGAAGGGGGTVIKVDVYDNHFQDGRDAGERINDALRRLGL